MVKAPGRDALNVGNFNVPLAFVRPEPIRTNVTLLARVMPVELMSTLTAVFTGRPLTTGATAIPTGTLASGAVATLVETGARTATATALA